MGYQLTFHVFRHRQLLDLASNLLGEKKPHGLAVLDASPAGAKQQKVLNQHQYGVQRGCRGSDLPARGSKSLSARAMPVPAMPQAIDHFIVPEMR